MSGDLWGCRSSPMEQCLVNTEVDYTLPFEMNDSFDVILSDFIETHCPQ